LDCTSRELFTVVEKWKGVIFGSGTIVHSSREDGQKRTVDSSASRLELSWLCMSITLAPGNLRDHRTTCGTIEYCG